MDEYQDISTFYDAYFTGVEGDVQFYVSEALRYQGAVLELGCGSGRITLPLAQAGCRVTGLDLSEQMLAIARQRLQSIDESTRRHVHLLHADYA